VTSAELIQFGEQIANLHRRRIEDAPGRGGSPPLRRRQATVECLPDHGGDRCTALPREGANPLVALIVDENLIRDGRGVAASSADSRLTAQRLTAFSASASGWRPGHGQAGLVPWTWRLPFLVPWSTAKYPRTSWRPPGR
jgi:hypothetical protein